MKGRYSNPLTPAKIANTLLDQGINLSDKQFHAVTLYLQGHSKTDACLGAGLPASKITTVFGSAKVQNAIGLILERFLVGDAAPAALRCLYQILHDDKAAPGVRVQAANSLLDRAGFDNKRLSKAADPAGDKPDADKTPAEIEAEIRALEASLKAKTKDVTPADSAPDSEPIDAQILENFR